MAGIGTVPERLARNRYEVDHEAPHIELDPAAAEASGLAELLMRVCPAHVYSRAPDGSLVVQHAACLECGACLAVAGGAGAEAPAGAPAGNGGALRWHYPRGGFGIVYREG